MTRDVLIRISGIQAAQEDNDNIEVITAGEYFLKNGKHYIIYEEVLASAARTLKNTIKVSPKGIDIIKRGENSVRLMFERNVKSTSSYVTPVGEMIVSINTDRFTVCETEDSLKVEVHYALDINYEFYSDCMLRLEVCSREKADLHLK